MMITELKETALFRGMSDDEIETALSSLRAREKRFLKGSFIFHAGDTTSRFGIVLDGSVTIETNDIWGNRTILSHIGAGQVFAETYALLSNEPMLVDVKVNQNSRILFLHAPVQDAGLNPQKLWMSRITFNLLVISSYKNFQLSRRSFHTSPKTIRGRVMSYLSSVSLHSGNKEFDIPFDRQALADYLNVERTALSKELGKMQKDGYFTVHKNHFTIHSSIEQMI
ncbi:MAG: Crp/Fnr family transcriptional regulator [Clostridia bacterium]|nr:Crp/Fnr family transcriptional regulator [Clostridia bacterium]